MKKKHKNTSSVLGLTLLLFFAQTKPLVSTAHAQPASRNECLEKYSGTLNEIKAEVETDIDVIGLLCKTNATYAREANPICLKSYFTVMSSIPKLEKDLKSVCETSDKEKANIKECENNDCIRVLQEENMKIAAIYKQAIEEMKKTERLLNSLAQENKRFGDKFSALPMGDTNRDALIGESRRSANASEINSSYSAEFRRNLEASTVTLAQHTKELGKVVNRMDSNPSSNSDITKSTPLSPGEQNSAGNVRVAELPTSSKGSSLNQSASSRQGAELGSGGATILPVFAQSSHGGSAQASLENPAPQAERSPTSARIVHNSSSKTASEQSSEIEKKNSARGPEIPASENSLTEKSNAKAENVVLVESRVYLTREKRDSSDRNQKEKSPTAAAKAASAKSVADLGQAPSLVGNSRQTINGISQNRIGGAKGEVLSAFTSGSQSGRIGGTVSAQLTLRDHLRRRLASQNQKENEPMHAIEDVLVEAQDREQNRSDGIYIENKTGGESEEQASRLFTSEGEPIFLRVHYAYKRFRIRSRSNGWTD